MRDLLHDVPLNLRAMDLLRLDYKVLLQCFYGENRATILLARKIYFTERTAPDNFEKLEVLNR